MILPKTTVARTFEIPSQDSPENCGQFVYFPPGNLYFQSQIFVLSQSNMFVVIIQSPACFAGVFAPAFSFRLFERLAEFVFSSTRRAFRSPARRSFRVQTKSRSDAEENNFGRRKKYFKNDIRDRVEQLTVWSTKFIIAVLH